MSNPSNPDLSRVVSPFVEFAEPFDLTPPDEHLVTTARREWSPQQRDIFDWVRKGRGSAFVEAVAGAGKTTTLIEACKLMRGSVAFAAYNRKIAEEIQAKLSDAGISSRDCRAGTFHSFGYSALGRSLIGQKLTVDERMKRDRMIAAIGAPEDFYAVVGQLVSLGKQAGAGFMFPIDGVDADQHWAKLIEHHDLMSRMPNPDAPGTQSRLIRFAQAGIAWSNNDCDRTLIDYDDMIYLPLLRNLRIWQNDWVLVDEAQDTNPARRALARRMLKPNGRAMFVGDPAQAIYGFTGADADSVDLIRREFGCKSLPLTVTYRCPKSVVAMAQQWVSHITAHESAPMGVTRSCSAENFAKIDTPTLSARDAILCRNTRPLVALAFQLIRRGVACHVEGRDIGAGLKALASRWKVTSCSALRKNLETYRDREVARAMAKGLEMLAQAVTDKVDTLFVLMEDCDTVDCVRAKIDRLFADNVDGKPAPNLTLSTIHKAKGREWDRVYILGMHSYMPSPYARQDWQKVQESNLCYVAVTRAQRELVVLPALG